MDFSDLYRLPETAVELSHDLIQARVPTWTNCLPPQSAACPGVTPSPAPCLRCGDTARWKAALSAPPDTPPEIAWRYQRPENAVPLCRACTMTTGFLAKPVLRIDLAWGLWGKRFEALWRWHKALAWGSPRRVGQAGLPLVAAGIRRRNLETGSGALEHATPRLPNGVQRTTQRDEIFWRALSEKGVRGRSLTDTHLRALVLPQPELNRTVRRSWMSRNLDPQIMTDPWFIELDDRARLGWMMLILNGADDQGRFLLNGRLMKSLLFPADDLPAAEVLSMLEGFAHSGKVCAYEKDGIRYGQIVHWWKYQIGSEWMAPSRHPAPEGLDRPLAYPCQRRQRHYRHLAILGQQETLRVCETRGNSGTTRGSAVGAYRRCSG